MLSSGDLKRIGLCFVLFLQNDSFYTENLTDFFVVVAFWYYTKLLSILQGNDFQDQITEVTQTMI